MGIVSVRENPFIFQKIRRTDILFSLHDYFLKGCALMDLSKSTVHHSAFHTSMLSWSYRRLHVARSSIGAKAGMELSRLRKVALKAGPTVSHHCPMWGMYRILGEVRFASTKICRTYNMETLIYTSGTFTELKMGIDTTGDDKDKNQKALGH